MNANMLFFEGSRWTRRVKRIIHLLIVIVLIAGFCEGKGEITGADIASEISLGNNVSMENEKIKGDIIIINRTTCKPMKIENCEIDGDLVLENSIFRDRVYFKNTTVLGQSSFSHSTFSKLAKFEKSRFKGKANFEDASFAEARFNESEFLEDAIFRNCSFNSSNKFDFATFNKDAIFTQAEFCDSSFNYASFHGDAYFSHTIFKKNVEFNSVVISGKADFYKAMFQGDAIFSKLEVSSDVDFSNAEFLKEANFYDSRFGGMANFRNASFKILNLNDVSFNQLYLPWKNAKDNLSCDEYLYLYLINSYKQRGLFDDVDDCYYYFKEHYPQKYPFSIVIEPMLNYLYGWGVRPFRTIFCAVLFIGLFGLYFWFVQAPIKAFKVDERSGIPENEYAAHKTENYPETINQNTFEFHARKLFTMLKRLASSSIFIALILSAKTFGSALTSIISETSLNGPAGNAAKLERFLAHVLAALFLIALTKTILREII